MLKSAMWSHHRAAMPLCAPRCLQAAFHIFFIISLALCSSQALAARVKRTPRPKEPLTYIWPLPTQFSFGDDTLSVDPGLSLTVDGNGGGSDIVRAAFDRYRGIIFKRIDRFSFLRKLKEKISVYDVSTLRITVHSASEELQLGVDESYTLLVPKSNGQAVAGEVKIEANTVYGALRGLENVLHWHIIDEQSFPLEIPSYPKLWKGSYTKWERYTVEDAYEIVNFAKMRGINVMAEVDVPGHAESWGTGYPELWPAPSCREPLDVSKKSTFDIISGILTDMRKIFPFELFHLGGDEVNTDCWSNTTHVKEWLQNHNMTAKGAYEYFVLKAQDIALSKNWTPVNWEETFNTFPSKLHPQTVVHNWLGPGVCPKAVAKGFRCIFSNQGVWYLDHLDVPWDVVYAAEPLEGIHEDSQQKLVLGGEVCMWGETADASDVQQTIWPRAAAAAERLWSQKDSTQTGNITLTALPRLQHFRCLLNRRGVPAAPVTNFYARTAPMGPGSCYEQ
ncbi:beta-hexosaminidase 1 isoform X2 [Prosopis cineraria]|uniref:beta-hexosaminidase 1 isoform X2 n=1 Tax=Prosopis cineraria TaxID=364024 RepID=UPI00240EFDA6|nr:beta-hexosaminidase 1 isoform X2 [Prosopis cineraria]